MVPTIDLLIHLDMEHLIANTGLHFTVREVEFNASEPLSLPDGRILNYAFCEMEDFASDNIFFDLLAYHTESAAYIPVSELRNDKKLRLLPNGEEETDALGLPRIADGEDMTLFTTLREGDAELLTTSTLESLWAKDPKDGISPVTAFSLLLGHWLPMPLFEVDPAGSTMGTPTGWCRAKIEDIGAGLRKGCRRYRVTWAFDTQTTDDPLSPLRPCFWEGGEDTKAFTLCNKADQLMMFLSTDEGMSAFSDYITALLGIDLSRPETKRFAHLAWYVYVCGQLSTPGRRGARGHTLSRRGRGDRRRPGARHR